MPVSMEDVRAVLEPEEPDYSAVAALGAKAMPHLSELAHGADPMLASKATYAASLIGGPQAIETVRDAARSDDASVRVAAAAAASNLKAQDASDVLESLVADPDVGVRKVARGSVPAEVSEALVNRMKALPDTPLDDGGGYPLDPSAIDGLMPGEQPAAAGMPGESSGLMPGESASDMPG